MKKSQKSPLKLSIALASAVFLASSFQAQAEAPGGTVILEGYIDGGIMVERTKGRDTKAFVKSGQQDASRINLIGIEPLSAETRVMFFLEQDFDINNGETKDIVGDRRSSSFNAQSTLSVINDRYGEFGLGHLYAFNSTPGATGWTKKMDPMFTFIEASLFGTSGYTNVSNAGYWISPRFYGWQTGLLFAINGEAAEESTGAFSKNNRFWNAALNYEGEKAQAILSLAGTMMGSGDKAKDPFQLRVGGNYQLGPVKLYGGYTYHKNNTRLSVPSPEYIGAAMELVHVPNPLNNGKGVDTNAFNVGFQIPYGTFTFLGQYQYMTGKVKNPLLSRVVFHGEKKVKKNVIALGTLYHLSKRSHLYGVVAWSDGKKGLKVDKTSNRSILMCGVAHHF